MPPKGNSTPPPSPLRSRLLLEISPLPDDSSDGAIMSSSFAVDEAGRILDPRSNGGSRRPPLVSGPITVPDLSSLDEADESEEGEGRHVVIEGDDADRAGPRRTDEEEDERKPRSSSHAAAVSSSSSPPHVALAPPSPVCRDESLPCPTALPRAAKAARTAGLAHPASPPQGCIFRRIREVEDADGHHEEEEDDEDEEGEDSDDDGALEEVRLEPNADASDGSAGASNSAAKTPPIPFLPAMIPSVRSHQAAQTPRRSSLKKPSSASRLDTGAASASAAAPSVHRRRISFSSLEIRTYAVTLGDHPCCSSGPPLSLGWEYDEDGVVSVEVEEYESGRGERRTRREMRMGCEARREMLLSPKNEEGGDGGDGGGATGMTERDLRRAERRVYREQHRTRAVQARKASGFFFATPPPSSSSKSSEGVVVRSPRAQRRSLE